MIGRCKYCRIQARRASVRIPDFDTIEICRSDDCETRAFYEHHPDLRPVNGPQ